MLFRRTNDHTSTYRLLPDPAQVGHEVRWQLHVGTHELAQRCRVLQLEQLGRVLDIGGRPHQNCVVVPRYVAQPALISHPIADAHPRLHS